MKAIRGQRSAVTQKKPRAKARREEQSLQAQLLQLVAVYAPRLPELSRLLHIPNGGGRSITEGKILKGQGVRSGVPDLELPIARPELAPHGVVKSRQLGYHRLYIEMKQPGGEPSECQRDWIAWLRSEGNCVQVCDSLDAAWLSILWYLRPRFPITQDFVADFKPRLAMLPFRRLNGETSIVTTVSGDLVFETSNHAQAVEFIAFCRGIW